MSIMSQWTYMGPEWKTEDIFRIREILRENHIPFKMPFSDVFFANTFKMPAADRRWGILVREKDLGRAAALLIRDGLACAALWPDTVITQEAAGGKITSGFLSPVPALRPVKGKG